VRIQVTATIGYPVPLPPPDGCAALLSDGGSTAADSSASWGFSYAANLRSSAFIPHSAHQF